MVGSVSALVYVGPITALSGSGGTLINSIERDRVRLELGIEIEMHNDAENHIALHSHNGPTYVRSPVHGANKVEVANFLSPFAVNDGDDLDPTQARPYAVVKRFPLLVRPLDPRGKWLYIPRAQMSPDSAKQVVWDVSRPLFPDDVEFFASHEAGDSGPAFFWGTAAALAAKYDLTPLPGGD